MWAQGLSGYQVNFSLEVVLEVKRQTHEVVKGLLSRLKLHKEIDIAGLAGFSAGK